MPGNPKLSNGTHLVSSCATEYMVLYHSLLKWHIYFSHAQRLQVPLPRIAQVTQIPATGQLFHPGWCDWLALPLHSAGDDSWLCAVSPHLQLLGGVGCHKCGMNESFFESTKNHSSPTKVPSTESIY